MYSVLTFLTRRGLLLAAAAALLFTPFMATSSYADEVPIDIKYTGALVPVPVNYADSLTGASNVDAQARGSFGASMTHIITEWVSSEGTCEGEYEGYDYQSLLHASMIVTFSNDDQLFSFGAAWFEEPVSGWMCLDMETGHFAGVAMGEFTGGTGRFAGAGGTFESPFSGYGFAGLGLGYGSGIITGSITGTVDLQ